MVQTKVSQERKKSVPGRGQGGKNFGKGGVQIQGQKSNLGRGEGGKTTGPLLEHRVIRNTPESVRGGQASGQKKTVTGQSLLQKNGIGGDGWKKDKKKIDQLG